MQDLITERAKLGSGGFVKFLVLGFAGLELSPNCMHSAQSFSIFAFNRAYLIKQNGLEGILQSSVTLHISQFKMLHESS